MRSDQELLEAGDYGGIGTVDFLSSYVLWAKNVLERFPSQSVWSELKEGSKAPICKIPHPFIYH